MSQHALQRTHFVRSCGPSLNSYNVTGSEPCLIQNELISWLLNCHKGHGDLCECVCFQDPPMSVVKKTDNILVLGGFFGEVWHALQQRMNFT
jgi:hypothetical protein